MAILNIWDATNTSVKWAFAKRYKPFNDNINKTDKSEPAVTWVIGIRLADMFVPSTIEIEAFVPSGYDYRIIGPHRGGQVHRRDLHKITVLCSPLAATVPQERQVQRHNYDTFVSTMAAMLQKYGVGILK